MKNSAGKLPLFTDQVVWITGASSGIGEALALAFAASGALLILSARRETELHRVAKLTGLPESKYLLLPLDLADADTLHSKAEVAQARWGRVDVMVHNGGISQRGLAKDTSTAVDRSIMEVNYFGTVGLTKALLPAMLRRKVGHFVVVSSLVGKFGTPLRSGYSASKHALHGFFESLRAEVWREGILVSLVCPGFIHTQVSVNALTGSGDKQNTMDEAQAKGMAAELCAHNIVQAISEGKSEVYIGGREVLAVYLKRFLPGLFAKIVRKAKVT